ncbi:MAG: NADH:flavin oxidoreductase [Burkholderiales bacterium]|nr:NADH:flavin oxidoreductase [Burkholderiales bacterium]
MSMSPDPLFRPYRVNRLHLANRIVMAPMTRSFSPGGVPGADVAAYYRRRAENGVGLIITEGTVIDHPASTNDTRVPHFHGTEALAGWANVLAEVHAAGAKIMPQIWHIGTVRRAGDRPNPEAPPIGPSGLYKPGVKVVEPMTDAQIAAVICAYARAAADARRLGFDGVELHGAHGYLIDQFFWEGTNQRSDRYGGDMLARTRFAVEVIQACRQAVGPDFPILLRYSQWKQQDYAARLAGTPELLEKFLAPLADAGVDVFHCSTRRFWEPEFEGSALNLAGWTKKLSGKPVITVGSVSLDNDMVAAFRGKAAAITSIDKLIEMVAREEVDLVAVGRAMLVDYAWAAKVRENRMQDLLPFTPESLRSLA